MRWWPSIRPNCSRRWATRETAAVASMTVEAVLADCGLPRPEALTLLASASGRSRERLIAGSKDELPATVVEAFTALAERRVAGEPIAYLVGYREFHGHRFAVDRDVLIPRPETELLVDQALAWVDERAAIGTSLRDAPALRVLDLGTGSGAIAVTLALERPALDIVATDVSGAALAKAASNAEALGASLCFLAGDWFDALSGAPISRSFDLIVCNPPYVADGDPHLDGGDLRFEPRGALTDDGTGLAAIARVVSEAASHLRSGGALMVEHGHDQAAAVRALFRQAGFIRVVSVPDLAGIERVATGRVSAPVGADGLAPAAL